MLKIRKESLKKVEKYRVPINRNLPLLENSLKLRDIEDILIRLAILDVVVSVAYGSNKEVGIEWLKNQDLMKSLTPEEKDYLLNNQENSLMKNEIDCILALSWVLGIINGFDYLSPIPSNLASKLPNIRLNESLNDFRKKINLINEVEAIQMLDIGYIIHSGLVELKKNNKKLPINIDSVELRRSTLEWCLSDQDWKNVNLDT